MVFSAGRDIASRIAGASLHLREQSAERVPVEAVAVGHVGDEAGDFRALAIERLRR